MTSSVVSVGVLGAERGQHVQLVQRWIDLGLIAEYVSPSGDRLVAPGQVERLTGLDGFTIDFRALPTVPDSLFDPQVIATLGAFTFLAPSRSALRSRSETLWMQLLPVWASELKELGQVKSCWREFECSGLTLYTLDAALANHVDGASKRMVDLESGRAPLFAHSANYMVAPEQRETPRRCSISVRSEVAQFARK
jgi:hypothetical protein